MKLKLTTTNNPYTKGFSMDTDDGSEHNLKGRELPMSSIEFQLGYLMSEGEDVVSVDIEEEQ